MSEHDSRHKTGNTTINGTFKLDEPPSFVDRPTPNPGALKTPPSLKTLGPYKIGREIGRGAMGTVYEAVHTQLQRTVALKVLPPELAESTTRLQRFRREMAAIGRLEHPNIVLATDAGDADGLCYIAMQFIDGRDLEAILADIGRFDPADACEIIRQTALGLQHILEQRLVHRDIKPSNIVLTKRGEAKILDLGIAMLRNVGDRETSMTAAGSLMGTPDYIAPEQISQCFDVDIRADIYSLGCTLYGLLSGKPPFTGPGYTTFTAKLLGHADREPPALAELCPEIPSAIVKLVEQMMSKDRENRPARPIDVANSLSEFCQDADLVPIATGQLRRRPVPARVTDANQGSNKHGASIRGPGLRLKVVGAAAACPLAAIGLWMAVTAKETQPVSAAKTPQSVNTTASALQVAAVEPAQAIAVSNQTIADNTTQIAGTLDQIRQQFEQAIAGGTTLERPRSPADHYFNARMYSQRGDYLKARQSYLAYFADELPVVDPHLQFIQILKLQEGIAGARELYVELPGDRNAMARRLATALLHPAEQRVELLEKLIEDEKDFAPAWYQLSREFSADRKTQRTLTDQVREQELLDEFLRLHNHGKLLKCFLDQTKAVTMLNDAEQRLKTLASTNVSAANNPVKFSLVMQVAADWKIGFSIAEAAVEIFYRVGEDGKFKSTGTISDHVGGVEMTDSRTGKPFPYSYVDLSGDTPKCNIYVQYTDADSNLRGPFALEFDPEVRRAQWQRSRLESSKREWLQLRGDTLDFSLFLIGRSQIESVVYGLDEETPSRVKSVPQQDHGPTSYQEYSVPIPATVQFATIQVTFVDGTQSEIVKIRRRD